MGARPGWEGNTSDASDAEEQSGSQALSGDDAGADLEQSDSDSGDEAELQALTTGARAPLPHHTAQLLQKHGLVLTRVGVREHCPLSAVLEAAEPEFNGAEWSTLAPAEKGLRARKVRARLAKDLLGDGQQQAAAVFESKAALGMDSVAHIGAALGQNVFVVATGSEEDPPSVSCAQRFNPALRSVALHRFWAEAKSAPARREVFELLQDEKSGRAWESSSPVVEVGHTASLAVLTSCCAGSVHCERRSKSQAGFPRRSGVQHP